MQTKKVPPVFFEDPPALQRPARTRCAPWRRRRRPRRCAGWPCAGSAWAACTWSRDPFHDPVKAGQKSVRNRVWKLKIGMKQWFCFCKRLIRCSGTNSVSHTLFLPPPKSQNKVGGGAWFHSATSRKSASAFGSPAERRRRFHDRGRDGSQRQGV